jgi:DNA (cytosine-5)-methyltransferase 1
MRNAGRKSTIRTGQNATEPPQKKNSDERLTVLDLYCGAGGFSEGFRSAGLCIVGGVDHWRPAVDTFNCNFDLNCEPLDVLSLEGRPEKIEQLPDTEIIIGSPPCVSFSYSNKLGNADKTEGLRHIKLFFSIVAIKKFKRGSRLLAWYMENVSNALKCLPDAYSFLDLGLTQWSRNHGLNPESIAIRIKDNSAILNAADFGVPQTRKRLFISEINRLRARRADFTVLNTVELQKLAKIVSGRSIRTLLPAPTCKASFRNIADPINREITIPLKHLTDHFYENGAYEIHWRESKLLKTSHPYMGRMAFPENEAKPSRTIVASPFPRSREALLYKSEWGRVGDGEYRGPTIREAASLMSFPITYQFLGSEGAKWKLVGNAVCPHVSYALAAHLVRTLGLKVRRADRTQLPRDLDKLPNLNTFCPKKYDKPPKRKRLARFRSHPLKAASMTVALTNYDVIKGDAADGVWRCFVTYGIGEGYRVQRLDLRRMSTIRRVIEQSFGNGAAFVEHVTNGFSERIPSEAMLQQFYEENIAQCDGMLGPNLLLEEIDKIIARFADRHEFLNSNHGLFLRDSVPVTQLCALFAVAHIVSTAKSKGRLFDESNT